MSDDTQSGDEQRDDAIEDVRSGGVDGSGDGTAGVAPAIDLSPEEDAHGIGPEAIVADSLTNALKILREDADQLASMPLDEGRVEAAEQLAEDAAALDEQIGSVARSDDE